VPEVVARVVAEVVVVLLVAPVGGELALQLLAMFGTVVGGLQLPAGAVVAAQQVFAVARITGLTAAVGVLLVQRGEFGLMSVVGSLVAGEGALGQVDRRVVDWRAWASSAG
jgi:hypothetical protein